VNEEKLEELKKKKDAAIDAAHAAYVAAYDAAHAAYKKALKELEGGE